MLPVMRNGVLAIEKMAEAGDFDERCRRAHTCGANVGIPVLVDTADNAAGTAYAAWPQRVYVVDPDGTIKFKGRPGTMTGQDLPVAVKLVLDRQHALLDRDCQENKSWKSTVPLVR